MNRNILKGGVPQRYERHDGAMTEMAIDKEGDA